MSDVWNGLKTKGSFSQNYAVVLSGTTINIVVQILVSPILTRIYSPEAYGVFSVFNALCANIAVIATLRFPQALLLPEDDRDFYALMRLSFLSSLLTSTIVFILLFFAAEPILRVFQAESVASIYFLIPIMVMLIAVNQIVGQWQYRLNRFKTSVALDTGVLVGVRIFNLTYGLLTNGGQKGLLLGDIVGKTAGVVLSGLIIIRGRVTYFFKKVSWATLKKVFHEYRQYPLFNLPGIWFSMFADQLPIFLISAAFGLQTVGVVSLATSMLDLPKRLFAYTVTSVFYKKAIEVNRTTPHELRKIVLRMMYSFLAISVVPYSLVAVFGPELFTLVFGDQWIMAGKVAQFIAIYCVVELLYISLDSLYYVLRQEKRLFAFQVGTFMVRLTALSVGIGTKAPLEMCILYLAIANFLLYAMQLSFTLHLLKINWKKHLFFIVAVYSATVAMVMGVKQLL